ncbi:MAG: enoyl-CoA hydratase/isomerase family protein [Acidimicrobiales bacterium]|nr:enoyl-CoA hydratase/isomerase family protein [Acidimicrobiales bacterium]
MPAEPDAPDMPHVLVDVADGVAVLTLNRPDKLNAFTGRMGDELGEAYQACDQDDRVRAVVVTGAGRGFCAGADLGGAGETFAAPGTRGAASADRPTPVGGAASGDGSSLAGGSLSDDGSSRPAASRPFTSSPVQPRAWEVRKPVIAAINGPALGIGLSLTMQCDLRYVAEDATLGFVHVRMGVLPDAHAHWTVPRAVGFAVAQDLLLTGRRFKGSEAAALGLVHRALPADEVLPAALATAREIATDTAPLSVAASKRLLWSTPALDADECDRLETAWHEALMGRADAREGPMAFLERRDPNWSLSVTEDWPADL